tara:strand:+ start:2370 stop:4703 length:2334 start_codon:yes stop_codon:yes gene_type:complete
MNWIKKIAASLDRSLSSASLRTKLIVLTSSVSFIVVGISMAISFVVEVGTFRERLLDEYRTTAHMLASNLEAAVAFRDERDASKLIKNLELVDHVQEVRVFLADGSVLASFRSDEGGAEKSNEMFFDMPTSLVGGTFFVNEAVHVGDVVVGKVVLEVSMHEVADFIFKKIWVFIFLMAVSVLLVVPLAMLLAHMIGKPIVELAETARRITRDHDFSTRQERQRDDETGELVDAFNEMMSVIEARDEQIRSSEERFRGYFDLGIVGAGVLNTRLVWEEANVRWLEMLGCDHSDLIGHSFLEVLDFSSSQVTIDHFDIIGESGDQIKVGDYWFKCKDGSSVYVLMSMRLVPGTAHTPEHVLVLAQDITDRKVYEEEMRMARDDAEASNRAKDEFLSVISHELRTPLNPILGYVNMILSDRSEDQDPVRLNYIRQSAEHLLGLIDNLLDYSRFERNEITCTKEEVPLREVCRDVVGLLREGAMTKGLDLEYVESWEIDRDPDRVSVMTDSMRLRQVLFNVISNAIKFTDKGTVKVVSELKVGAGGMGSVRIKVVDTGIGIAEGDKERVFRPFAQIDGSMSREYAGMGLGMAISRKIVQALGGRIDFSSVIGKGSRFWIDLELEVIESSLPENNNELSDEWSLTLSVGDESILLVEDDALNRELASSLIQSSGYRVVCAKDGMEAIDLFKEETFSLIVLDVRMPRLNGFETAKIIRKLERGKKRVPIVAITAHVTNEVREKCISSGMDDYLTKPLDSHKLKVILAKWLVKDRSDDEVEYPS